MAENKRKQPPSGSSGGALKKRQGGSGGRWKTPHQKNNQAQAVEIGKALDVGDQGFWVTYARGMKFKAMREMQNLAEEYGESMYGIKRPAGEAEEKDEEDGPEDIEASIKAELDGMKEKRPAELKTFSIIPAEVECLFFVKTQAPVDPVEFVRKVCIDARDCDDIMKRKVKYINRLSPVVSMEKATENGLLRVARRVMGSHFGLVKEEPKKDDSQEDAEDGKPKDDQVSEAVGDEQKASEGPGDEAKPSKVETGDTTVDESSTQEPMESAYTYALRPTTRSHQHLKRDVLINKLASLVRPEHKVNLTSPDKVVLVEIYQMFCGMSVVDGGEWESLKRYNMNELYRLAADKNKGEEQADKSATASA